jgi:hypothetical protein
MVWLIVGMAFTITDVVSKLDLVLSSQEGNTRRQFHRPAVSGSAMPPPGAFRPDRPALDSAGR